MRKLFLLTSVMFGLGLGGCGGGDKFDEVLKEMEGIKNKMCECKDKACTEKVQDEWRAYRKSMKDKIGKDAKPSDAQDKKGNTINDEMRKCRDKYDGEPTPPAPTPTEAAPSGSAAPTP